MLLTLCTRNKTFLPLLLLSLSCCSPSLSYQKQPLAFSPTKSLGCFSKGLHIYFLCFFSAVGCRSQILKDWPTGSCHAGNQEGYLQETLDFIVLPTGTAFLLPAVDSAQSTYSDISRRNKTYVPYELHGKATPIQHKFCKTHSIAKEHLHLQPGFVSQPTTLETDSV